MKAGKIDEASTWERSLTWIPKQFDSVSLHFQPRLRLLLSGDVESNPGPGRKEKNKPKSTGGAAEGASVDVLEEYDIIESDAHISPEQLQTSEAVDIPGPNRTNIVAITPSSDSYKSHEDSTVVSLTSSASKDKELKASSESKKITPSSHGLSKTDYIEEIKQRKPYLTDSKRCMSSELTSNDCLAILMSKTLNNTSTDRSLSDEEKKHYVGKVEDNLKKFLQELKSKNLWAGNKGFLDSNPNIFEFFLLANQIIHCKGTCFVCVLCGKNKDQDKMSPIFPQTLLDSFQKIHGEEAGRMACASNSNVSLFCSDCEELTTQAETQLRDLYLTIMDPNRQDQQIEIQSPGWLLHILAAITFRGLFTRNFVGELQNNFDQLIRLLATLRSYIASSSTEVPPEIASMLGLYILPHGVFSIDDNQPNICMSQHLRLPQPTTIVRINERAFLYAQFDCFHWILPYTEKPIPGLCSTPDLVQQRSFNTSPGITETCEFFLIDISEKRKNFFPKVLIRENHKRAVSYQMNSILISHDFLESLPPQTSSGTPNRSLLLESTGSPFAYTEESPKHEFETITDDDECQKIYKRAKKESPFSQAEHQRVQVAKEEQLDYIMKRYKELEVEHSLGMDCETCTHYQEKLDVQAAELEALKLHNADLSKRNKELEEEIEMLHQRMPPQTQSILQPDQEAGGMYEPPLKPM